MARNKNRKLKGVDSSTELPTAKAVFEDSYRSIRRASKHIEDLKLAIEEYSNSRPYKQTEEFYGDGTKKAFKATSFNRIPDDVVCCATDAVYNLRASLDQAVFSAADAARKYGYSGIDRTKSHWAFPIKCDLAKVNSVIESICEPKGIPVEIGNIISRIQPYRGGSGEVFYGLLKAANVSKHRNFVTMMSTRDNIRVRNRGDGGVLNWENMSELSLPVGVKTADPMAPCTKDEILMLTTNADDNREYEIEITLNIKFDRIPFLDSNDCVSHLALLVDLCEGVVNEFSDAYVDLGICR